MPMRVGDPVVGLCRRNRMAVGYPPYVCQHVLVFSSNLFGSIVHRGGRDARVPVLRRFAAITRALPYAMIFCPFRALM
ncbi:MAG: hypothetical protein LBQ66_09805 [Planctomycetaceae bacterium]|nr:hypothetical protein [Planctomycetaceae bacterium]